MPTTMRVHVQDHCLLVGDASDTALALDLLDWSSGIAGTMPTALLIDAGIQSGTVTVTAESRDERPPLETPHDWAATADWDDISEVSIDAPLGMLTIAQLHYPPGTEPGPAPILSSHGPGPYRLRLHVRGRDQQYDQVADHSDVHLHIVAWPGPATASLIIKATSRCGYGLRMNEHQRTAPTAVPSSSGQQEQPEHDILIQQALESSWRQAHGGQPPDS